MAQSYLGVGFHLTPPVAIEYSRNPYVIAKPQLGFGGSITYKKEWSYRPNKKWYAEAGLTLQGLRYYQVDYHGDSITIWTDWYNQHTGFPSILLGAGHSFRNEKSKDEFLLGLEASFLITQDLGEIYSYTFGIINHPVQDAVFPLFLRLNIGYSHAFHFFRSGSGQLQLYTSLSAQKLTKGTQYIRNIADGSYLEGRYHVNNSELGIKVFACLNKKTRAIQRSTTTAEKAIFAQAERKTKYRVSLVNQLYVPPRTIYHIPKVDSFSIKGRGFIIASQFGVIVGFPHRKNDLWSTVAGLGIGKRVATLVFKSDGRFPSDNLPVENETHILIGHYAIASLGLSRRYTTAHLVMAHSLFATVVLPLEKEYAYLGVPLHSSGIQAPPFDDPVLEGRVDYKYGREPILFGIEYNPEIFFSIRPPFFVALGLVANYSRGVIAQGKFEVSNSRTTYYGALLQNFSKLGVSIRIGFRKSA